MKPAHFVYHMIVTRIICSHLLPLKVFYSVNEKLLIQHVEEDLNVQRHTQLHTKVTNANRESNPKHINFVCPVQPCAISTAYNLLLDQELVLRKLFPYISTPVEIKQKDLLLSIQNSEAVKDLRCAVER